MTKPSRPAERSRDTVVSAVSTDGSESHAAVLGIHDDPPPAELARIRRGEAVAAAKVLGVPPEDVVLFHLQDTQLLRDAEPLQRAVLGLFQRYPEVATVYFPDPDREMNADHRVTGATVLHCVQQLGLTPRLMKYVVWTKDLEVAFQFQNRLAVPAVIDDAEPVETVDIRQFHAQKMAALAEHKTQMQLFSPSQTRTVVPPWLLEKLDRSTVEQFRVHPLPHAKEQLHGDSVIGRFEEARPRQ